MKNTVALVSIITPCYNAAPYIAQTIESVLAQTYPYWEMIVVDDCSTDDSASIIKGYAAKDARIKYFKTGKKSGSPAEPRNVGIENSRGEYVAFLDSDDIWLPDKLKWQIEFMKNGSYDVGYSYYEKIDSDGKRQNRCIRTRPVTTYSLLLKSNSIPCLTSIVRRDAIGDTRFKHIPQEDFCFWLDILKKGHEAHNICRVTALYREAGDSRSANKLDMFKGFWSVIRHQQHISLPRSLYYMLTYTILGVKKYMR